MSPGQKRMINAMNTGPLPVSAEGPINILIVDDEPKNLTVLETILDDPDYRLVRAESADQALLALVVEEFALIILDIRMPGMTGDRKSTRLNSSHTVISYAVFCLKKKNNNRT